MEDCLFMSERKDRRSKTHGAQRDTVTVRAPRQRATSDSRGAQRDTVRVSPRPRSSSRLRGVLTAGALTSSWNALVVVVPILVAVILAWWAVGRPGGVATVVRAVGAMWLYGHGVPVGVSRADGDGATLELTLGVAPLLLTAVIAWRLFKAGAHTVRAFGGRDAAAARAATLTVTLCYTALVTVTAWLASAGPFAVSTWQAAAHAAVLCLLAGGLGGLAESGAGAALWGRVSPWLRRGVRTGALYCLSLLAAGALLAGTAFAVRGAAVARTVPEGVDGALAVGLLTLLFVPTAAIWGAAYALGPGFSIGVGTQFSVMEVSSGPMPVFPVFAAAPGAPLDWWGTALWGLPVVIGILHGVLLATRSVDLGVSRLLAAVFAAAAVTGALTAAACFLASGPVGEARMAVVGPQAWSTAGVAAVVLATAATAGALSARMFGARRR